MALIPVAVLLSSPATDRFALFLPSLLPILVAGLSEDLGWPVSARNRLLAAGLSSAIAIALLGSWLPRTHFPGLDLLMGWAPFAIVFTVFACSGICNAFNLIDGMNGLSASVGSVVALAMAVVAARAGQESLLHLNLMVTGALMGFLVFNFPLGKIFLGDAGAYSLGHILSWTAIALLIRIPDLTPWAVLLIFFWPVADTGFAIYRRKRAGRPTDQPDRLHFHQLVMRALEIRFLGRGARARANPLTTVILAPMFTAPALAGVILWDQPITASLTLIGFTALFIATYRFGMIFARRTRNPLGGGSERSLSISAP